MRGAEPLDPDVVLALEAIDATLHGEPVDPELAELAELSLILRDARPEPDAAFLATLDERARRRFAPAPRVRRRADGSARGLWWAWGTGLAAVAATVVGLVVFGSHGGAGVSGTSLSSGGAGSTVSSSTSASAGAASHASASSAGASSSAKVPAGAPAPRGAPGRDITQSARLVLRAQPGRIDPVAQQVFEVVGAEHGDVDGSHIVDQAGGAGNATFSLSVPSARLQSTLTRLSALRDAQVTSREDASSDITGTVNATAARLATARALRRSLLRQLAAATTTTEVDQLQAALRRNEATIVADANALAGLHAKVADSAISVTVSAPPAAGPHHRRRASGFGIGGALHDAGRVLVVVVAVALIALAVLVPLGLLVALGAWVWALTLRRRREGALDR